MTTIWCEEPVAVSADEAWNMLQRVDKTHELFAPVLVDGQLENGIRVVSFANGLVVSERIVSIDHSRRRIAYTVLGEMFDFHMASMQVLPVDEANCRFLWISDFLPDDRSDSVRPLVEEGSKALARNIEGARGVGFRN